MADLYRRTGCELRQLVQVMRNDQREHLLGTHPETYARFRTAVVEWMLDVADYFRLHATTAHLAAAFLDRLQPSDKFTQKEWQLLAVCCIIISAKYNECEDQVPDLYTMEEITKQRLPNETILNYELWILKKMGWKLNGKCASFRHNFCILRFDYIISVSQHEQVWRSCLASRRRDWWK